MNLNVALDSVKNGLENLQKRFSEWTSPESRAKRGLPKDIKLIQVAGIAIHRNFFGKKRPHLILNWEGRDEWESVPIELATMMVSQSTYENKARLGDNTLEKLVVTISGEQLGRIRRIEGDVQYRRYATERGVILSVTNFELARALFFHNQYLIRAAFSPSGLKDIARYNDDSSDPKIIFPDTTSYPVSNIKSRKSKSHLAWLMTDSHAIRSFFSVFEFVNKIESSEVYDFTFTPPPLAGWEFEVAGCYSEDRNTFWVSEVLTINNHSFTTPVGLNIKHPKLKHLVPVPNTTKPVKKLPPSDLDPEFDMGDLPKLGNRLHQKDDQSFSFNMLSAGNIGLDIDDEKERPEKSKSLPSNEKKSEAASVGAAVQEGNNQEFDYGLNRGKDDDDSEDLIDAEPTEKFRLFERTIDVIKNKKGFTVKGVRCGSFPPPKTGSRMVLNTVDGNFLRYHMANIRYLNVGAVVIEVDVDSLNRPKNVSTLVIAFSENSNPEQILKTILQDYSDLARGWNHDWIEKNTAICNFCRHPKKTKKENDVERPITADEYVEAWAEILCGKLRDIRKLADLK
jgi:hypothetical protein